MNLAAHLFSWAAGGRTVGHRVRFMRSCGALVTFETVEAIPAWSVEGWQQRALVTFETVEAIPAWRDGSNAQVACCQGKRLLAASILSLSAAPTTSEEMLHNSRVKLHLGWFFSGNTSSS